MRPKDRARRVDGAGRAPCRGSARRSRTCEKFEIAFVSRLFFRRWNEGDARVPTLQESAQTGFVSSRERERLRTSVAYVKSAWPSGGRGAASAPAAKTSQRCGTGFCGGHGNDPSASTRATHEIVSVGTTLGSACLLWRRAEVVAASNAAASRRRRMAACVRGSLGSPRRVGAARALRSGLQRFDRCAPRAVLTGVLREGLVC